MSLGDKLQKTIQELEEANLKTLAAKEAAVIEKVRRDREKRQQFVDGIRDKIVDAILAERVPQIKIKDWSDQDWIRSAEKGKAKFQAIWSDFIRYLGKEKLQIKVIEEHDGMGMESWITLTVIPTKDKIVYRSDGTRQPTRQEQYMDPRPVPDPRMVADEQPKTRTNDIKRILRDE